MRKVFVSQLMSNAHLDASYDIRNKNVKKMMYENYKKIGQLVNVGELASTTIINSVMNMVWGDILKGSSKGNTVSAEFRAATTEQMILLGAPNISDLFPFLARFDLQGIAQRMKTICSRCEDILNLAIDTHNSGENIKQKSFLGYLLQLSKFEDTATSLTLPQIKAILMDGVAGATDTTSSLVEWAMTEVLQNAQVMRKIQEELTEIVGLNSTVKEVDLGKLMYLNAVVKETLRLHPPLPILIPHCPSKDSTIGGYSIPKDARVFLNVYAIHRDPGIWEDPLMFQPERFLSNEKMDYLGNNFQYLPFGSGRRMCPGIPLGERTSMLVLATLLHAFHWKLPDGSFEVDKSERFGVVVKKDKPLLAIPTPRLFNLDLYFNED